MLVYGFYSSLGDDLDTNDDGILDVIQFEGIYDSVALVESIPWGPAGGDLIYSENTVGPDGSSVPSHIYRCDDNTWVIGEFTINLDTPGESNSSSCPE